MPAGHKSNKIIMQLWWNCFMQFSCFYVVNTVISISGTYLKMLISNPSFAYKWFFPAKFVFTFLYILYKLQSTKIFTPKNSKTYIICKILQIYPHKNLRWSPCKPYNFLFLFSLRFLQIFYNNYFVEPYGILWSLAFKEIPQSEYLLKASERYTKATS